MKNRYYMIILLFAFCFVLSPSTLIAQEDALPELRLDDDDYMDEPMDIYDPWEGFNRKMYKFNDWTYRHVFNPIADGSDFIFPDFVQDRFGGVVSLSRMPIRFFNNAFQGKFKNAGTEFGRFTVNASVGIAGMFDPADHFLGWEKHSEDFGQTLGVWGMDSGRYLILPLFGPSNTRDFWGRVVDRAFSPFTWFSVYDVEDETAFRVFRGLRYVHNYAVDAREDYEAVTEDALDPYSSIRHIYTEIRQIKIDDGTIEGEVFEGAYEE